MFSVTTGLCLTAWHFLRFSGRNQSHRHRASFPRWRRCNMDSLTFTGQQSRLTKDSSWINFVYIIEATYMWLVRRMGLWLRRQDEIRHWDSMVFSTWKCRRFTFPTARCASTRSPLDSRDRDKALLGSCSRRCHKGGHLLQWLKNISSPWPGQKAKVMACSFCSSTHLYASTLEFEAWKHLWWHPQMMLDSCWVHALMPRGSAWKPCLPGLMHRNLFHSGISGRSIDLCSCCGICACIFTVCLNG